MGQQQLQPPSPTAQPSPSSHSSCPSAAPSKEEYLPDGATLLVFYEGDAGSEVDVHFSRAIKQTQTNPSNASAGGCNGGEGGEERGELKSGGGGRGEKGSISGPPLLILLVVSCCSPPPPIVRFCFDC